MLANLLSLVYCRKEACKQASDRSLLCLIYIHMLCGFVFTRLPWWHCCHQYLLPFAAERESYEGFLILFYHQPTSLSESLYFTTHGLAREDGGFADCCVEWGLGLIYWVVYSEYPIYIWQKAWCGRSNSNKNLFFSNEVPQRFIPAYIF